MILYNIEDAKELQRQINEGTVKVTELKKLSELNQNGFLRIDKVKFRFIDDSNAEDKKLRYQVYTYFDEGVDSVYLKEEFKKTAASELQKDFKRNKDAVFALYKIFSFSDANGNSKLALCRKFIELTFDIEEEAMQAFIDEHKNYINIMYLDTPYSIIKIIGSDEQWTARQNLSSYNFDYMPEYDSISDIEAEQVQQEETSQNSRQLF